MRRPVHLSDSHSERITYLEQQQQSSQGPSDEQVERVLRKILAERFGNGATSQAPNPSPAKDVAHFVKPLDSTSIPRAPPIDPTKLQVDPEAVPSRAYGHTLQMLERGLSQYPQTDVSRSAITSTPVKEEEASAPSGIPNNHGRVW